MQPGHGFHALALLMARCNSGDKLTCRLIFESGADPVVVTTAVDTQKAAKTTVFNA
jgi:hypothetical protein